ncbi:MAG: hypothetical protein ABEJ72_11130 [Candidatus Aenigmatarchaeota archaeon]
MDDVKQEEKEILEELEEEVEEAERDFSQIKSDNVPETTREKQEMVENLLEEVHQQLDFLKNVIEKE